MSILENIGNKAKELIKKNPVIEKSIEGVVEKSQEVISASMDPENNPEIQLGLMVGGFVATSLLMMWIFHTTPDPHNALPVIRDVTINNYYGYAQ